MSRLSFGFGCAHFLIYIFYVSTFCLIPFIFELKATVRKVQFVRIDKKINQKKEPIPKLIQSYSKTSLQHMNKRALSVATEHRINGST